MSTAGPDPQAEEESNTTTKVVLISVVAAIGGFLFGFDTAVINGAVDAVTGQFGLSATLSGFAVSCALLGAALGAWFAGGLADRFGRKIVMIIGAVLFGVSAVGSASAFGVWDFILWRALGGVGVGVASVVAPTYIAEVAPARIRGRLGSLQQLAITVGIFVALLTDAFIANSAGGAAETTWLGWEAWRWMFLVEIVPALVWGLLALEIPESPRYLVAQGETQKAGEVLREVLGTRSTEAVRRKVGEIRTSLQREDEPSLRDLRGPRLGLKPIVWIGILLSVFQQAVGINVIFYYSTSLWRSVGFESEDAFTTSTITAVTNVVVTFIAIATVDKIGRKPLLIAGSATMFVALAVMSVSFSQSVGTGEDISLPGAWGPVAVVAANLFVIGFGATWGPIVWVLLGEMFPNRIRAAALAVAAAAQWLANFTISTTFPPMSEHLGLTFSYGVYAAFALLSFFFVLKAVPETKGRELEDMGTDEPAPHRA
ncbi:sugar porter family MFS transporter [Paenibacillus sp. TRM 82003]|uniref:sugar porter family MFS transporter n=1 Tax=Kineococcus sp. TRM81007 TaxID=2925831 RepID=UPI001F5A8DB6|nr:sugar porter family MFS transporter [Kineococcus sp. TRM81007]MCI2240047.1 sugar porter family MFS transporter [Kineococcus sp. TRM81007]MCI3925647.1 sugar porter family MFS transporter [Paenibacillus sp. TRM 82003]